MKQPKALIEFKKLTHVYYIAHTMANHGMSNTANEIAGMDAMNPEGVFQVGTKDIERKAVAEIPTKFALSGMEKNGPFSQLIAHGIIVLIYELWNEDYRSKIAKELGCKTNEVICDVMGDLRHIRNWITHNGSIADNKIKDLTVLKWPSKKGPFAIKSEEINEIQLAINLMQVYRKK